MLKVEAIPEKNTGKGSTMRGSGGGRAQMHKELDEIAKALKLTDDYKDEWFV